MKAPPWVVAVASGVAAVLLIVLIVVVTSAESPPTATEALASAQRFVEHAESVQYHGESRTEYHDPEFPEDDFTDKSTFDDAARFPDEAHSVAASSEFATESILVDDVTYTREADRRAALEDELWVRYEPVEGDELFSFAPSGFLVPATLWPKVIATAERPRLVAQDDDRSVVRVRVDTAAFEEIYYANVRLDLVIEDDGRITGIAARAGDEYESARARIEIERWNGDVDIHAPAESEIDPTPSIEEEDIAAFDDAALFQPRVVPGSFALSSAGVLLEGESFDVEGNELACDQVNLYFADAAALEDEEFVSPVYLNLNQFPASCSDERPDDAEDFVAGTNTGWFDEEEGYLYGRVIVGDTVIEFDTDLDVATLMATLADLVPLDLAALPQSPNTTLVRLGSA